MKLTRNQKRLLPALLVVVVAAGCSDKPRETLEPVSYSAYDPGTVVTPTSESSLQLMSADGPTRFATFQNLITKAGKRCSFVTSAVLKGGIAGTDEWRVKCADSADWSIWLGQRAPQVLSCSEAKCL